MRTSFNSKWQLLGVLVLASLILSGKSLFAQTVMHGREQAMGVFNFSRAASYYASHPDSLRPKATENEADDDYGVPYTRGPVDSARIRARRTSSMSLMSSSSGMSALLPLSPAPSDTFQAILDNGTSIPPDTHGDVDSAYCITAINPNVRIQTRAGATVSTVTLDQFFLSIVPGGETFDPRVNYDKYTKRWYLIADANGGTDSNLLIIAISQTSDPTGAWYQYRIVTDASGVSWWDYPTVGFNKKWIAISGNRFDVATNAYQDTKLFVFDKAALLAGTGAPYTAFLDTSFTISPAITYDTTVSSLFAIERWNGGTGLLKMWKITGAVGSESFSSVGFPSSTNRWQSRSFARTGTSGADFAPQAGTTNLLQTNDDRIYDCKYINNTIWCSHTVFLPYSTSVNATRASVQWWQIDTSGTPLQNGLIDDPTNTRFFFFPAIAVNKYDDALIGFSTSTATSYASAGYALHLHTEPVDSIRPHIIYRNGRSSYYQVFSGTRNRFGDYSNSSVDPVNMTDFWTIQECASPTTNTWDTWWAHVRTCVPPPASITAAGPTTFCTGGSVVLNANTGTGLTYQWTSGGTSIAGATNASYTANAAGSYAVVVTSVSCDSTSAPVTVTVNTAGLAAITATATTVCVGRTINLTHVTTGGTWTTGGASIATVSATGVVTGVGAGSVNITYTANNGCGTYSTFVPITVNANPTVAAITGTTAGCTGGSLTLSSTTTGGVWSSATPATATVSTTGVVTGVATGSTLISYTVTSGAGCSTSVSTTFTVSPPFSASISAGGSTSFCSGGNVVLTATSGSYSYQWSNGGVPIAGATTSSYTATTGGIYTATLAQGGCSVTTTGITVTILTAYAAAITGASGVCTGGTTILSDSTIGGSWSSSNTTIATINSTGIVTGLTPGTVTITYTFTNTCGTVYRTAFITVSNPTTVAVIAGSTSVCPGSSSILTNATGGGVWQSSNTSLATVSTTGTVTGIATGTPTISYAVTNAYGCTSYATTAFTVLSVPSATITASGPTTICLGARVTLSAPTGSGLSYQWQLGGANITGATNATYSASTSGSFGVVVTNFSTCSASATPVTVSVTGTLSVVPAVTLATTPGTVMCTGAGAVSFAPTAVNGGTAPAFTWYVNGGVVSSAATYSYVPANGDVVICKLTSNANCAFPDTALATVTLTVNPYVDPAVSINAIPSDTVCAGSTGAFTAAPVNGGTAPSYTWNKNGSDVYYGPAYYYTPTDGDVLILKMRSNYACRNFDDATSSPLTVHVVPLVANGVTIAASNTSIVAGEAVTFTATALTTSGTLTYQWMVNGIPVAGATNSTFTTTAITNGQMVTCQLTTTDRCTTPSTVTSSGIMIRVSTKLQDLAGGTDHLVLEPNPNNGIYHIKGAIMSQANGQILVKVTNMLGQVVYTGTANATNNVIDTEVQLGNQIASGIYNTTVTVLATGQDYVFRMVVNK